MKANIKAKAKLTNSQRLLINWITNWGKGSWSQWGIALIGCLLTLTPLLSLSSPAFGEISFGIKPMEMQLKAPAQGGQVTDAIDVYNGGDVTLYISAYTVDWAITEAGEFQFLAPGSHQRSCANWIQINPVAFVLEPQKIVRVRYAVNAPKDLSGEYWAIIFFQSRPLPVKGKNNVGMNVSSRVGCKVFITPERNLPKQGKITDMIMEPGSKDRLKVFFENSGMSHVRLKGKFEVRSEDGQVIAKGELEPSNAQVLAGQRRELWVKLDKPLPTADTCRIRTIVDYGSKELVAGDLTVKGDLKLAAATGEASTR